MLIKEKTNKHGDMFALKQKQKNNKQTKQCNLKR